MAGCTRVRALAGQPFAAAEVSPRLSAAAAAVSKWREAAAGAGASGPNKAAGLALLSRCGGAGSSGASVCSGGGEDLRAGVMLTRSAASALACLVLSCSSFVSGGAAAGRARLRVAPAGPWLGVGAAGSSSLGFMMPACLPQCTRILEE